MPEQLCLALFPEHLVPGLCMSLCWLFTNLSQSPGSALSYVDIRTHSCRWLAPVSKCQAFLHPLGEKNFQDVKLFG